MSKDKIYIQKFEATKFSQEIIPFAQISRDVIQNISDPLAGFIWVYLQSLPPTWKPNKHHLMKHFDISERTYERRIAFLCKSGLIAYQRSRDKNGRLGEVELIVLNGDRFNSNPNEQSRAAFEIIEEENKKIPYEIKDLNHTAKNGGMEIHHSAKKPRCGDLADYINKDNKKINKKTTTTTKKTEKPKSSSNFVISKEIDEKLLALRDEYMYKKRGLKHNPELDRTDEEFLKQCSHHLDNGDKNKYNLARRLKGLETIIKSGFFEKPAGYSENKVIKSQYSPEDSALIHKYQHALRIVSHGAKLEEYMPDPEEVKKAMRLMEKSQRNKKPIEKRHGLMGFNQIVDAI
jgi:hypothetical protein